MDMVNFLKSRFEMYHKMKSTQFNGTINNMERRISTHNKKRRETRQSLLMERRNIVETKVVEVPVKEDRKTLLKKWKEEKDKQMKREKGKQKPIFRCGGALDVGFPRADTFKPPKNLKALPMPAKKVEIKPDKVEKKPEKKKEKLPQFLRVTRSQKPIASPPLPLPAPSRRKKEQEQANKKPLKMTQHKITTKEKPPISTRKVTMKTPEKKSKPVLSSLKTLINTKVKKTLGKGNTEVKKTVDVDKKNTNVNESVIKMEETKDLKSATPVSKTPVNDGKKTTRESVYISPFITTVRGKGNKRRENEERSRLGLPDFTKYTTPDKDANMILQATGAAHFEKVLNSEIERLTEMCKIWTQYKEQTADILEDSKDLIDVATGQANLLMAKKFQQFRNLIMACQNNAAVDDGKLVTCEDLEGFWDMIYIQVENINTRFARLTELKSNNWLEIMPEVKKPVAIKKQTKAVKASKPSSNLRAAIQAARKKVKANNETLFDGGFFVVKSPEKRSVVKTPKRKSRTSLLVSVLSDNMKKQNNFVGNASPGDVIIKASRTAKSIENIAAEFVKEFAPLTPKSILKTRQSSVNSINLTKTVLFKDDNDIENEIGANLSNLIIFDSPETNVLKENTPRRSKRLSERRGC